MHLLTGGGGGVMEAVSEAFARVTPRRGVVMGVLPGGSDDGRPPLGYPNPFVEIPIQTHLPERGERGTDPRSRSHLMVLTADVLVALPGGAGTAAELTLAHRYGVPVVGFGPGSCFAGAMLTRHETELPAVAAFIDQEMMRDAIRF